MPNNVHTLEQLIARRNANRTELQQLGRKLGDAIRTHRFLRDGDNIACYYTADLDGAA